MSKLKNIFKQAQKNEKLQQQGKLTTNDFYVNTNGMSYKDFKKAMKANGWDANSKEARGFFYTQLDPDIAPIEQEEVIQKVELPYTIESKKVMLPINPVIPIGKEKVKITPKVITTEQNKPKKWYEGQDWSTDQIIVPVNSGNKNNWGVDQPVSIIEPKVAKTSNVKNSNTSNNRIYMRVGQTTSPAGYSGDGNGPIHNGLVWIGNKLYNVGKQLWETRESAFSPNNRLYLTQGKSTVSRKQGGKMNKLQTGGQVKSTSKEQDAVMQFVKALAQTLQADSQQVIQAAQQNPEALKSAVQVYQESKGDIQKAAQAFSQVLQSKTQAAKHGAKLNYLKSLKNQCADDEELYYFKKGGSIGCGCKKKEQGGELKEKKESTVSKFKKACGGFKVKFMAGGQSPKKKNLDQASKDSIEINDNQNMGLMSERPGKLIPNPKYDKGKTDDRAQLWVPDRTKAPYKKEEKVKKDCGGSKMKLKKGDKVCPKCGKVHAAGTGCSVAKFKYRKLGGQL